MELSPRAFPSPSPLEVPNPTDLEFLEDDIDIIEDDLDIVDDADESADSGWRKMFQSSEPHKIDEDELIELD